MRRGPAVRPRCRGWVARASDERGVTTVDYVVLVAVVVLGMVGGWKLFGGNYAEKILDMSDGVAAVGNAAAFGSASAPELSDEPGPDAFQQDPTLGRMAPNSGSAPPESGIFEEPLAAAPVVVDVPEAAAILKDAVLEWSAANLQQAGILNFGSSPGPEEPMLTATEASEVAGAYRACQASPSSPSCGELERWAEMFRNAGGPPPAQLWDRRDTATQARLDRALERVGLDDEVARGELGVALVDLSGRNPRVAEVNGDDTYYAASLPKIAILLGAFEKAAAGELELDEQALSTLEQMIRWSKNPSATEAYHFVGPETIAETVQSPKYRLYDPLRNGGLWAGKQYAGGGVWKRDPIHNLSHGGSAMQIARFYTMLNDGDLVDSESSAKMREIMGVDLGGEGKPNGLNHKFVHALHLRGQRNGEPIHVLRKSGSWDRYHSDSVLVEAEGRKYVLVALGRTPATGNRLGNLAEAVDDEMD